MNLKIAAIIPAAGSGSRIENADVPKQFLEVAGKQLLQRTVEAVASSRIVEGIYLVVPPADVETVGKKYRGFPKICSVVAGGDIRSRSVYNGVVEADAETVLIHDAARPFVTPKLIEKTIESALTHGAATAALPVVDTVMEKNDGFIGGSLNREKILLIQTPQAFRRSLLLGAFARLMEKSDEWSDETSMLESLGIPVAWVKGDPANIKITTNEDLELAEAMLLGKKSG